MSQGEGKVLEIWLEGNEPAGRIACPPAMRPAPGQYLLASSPDPLEPLPVALFPALPADREPSAGCLTVAALPANWNASTPLLLRGPLGKGFSPPVTAHKIALAVIDGPSALLMPVALQALERGAPVTLYAGHIPARLPNEIEVQPLEALPEAAAWADYLAISLSMRPSLVSELRKRLGLSNPFAGRCPIPVQVLVRTAMPCGGVALCGVCSVYTRSGWQLACKDGPVFELDDLEEE